MKRILIAFDKFKDALAARAAGETVASALREMHPDWIVGHAPLTDGGESFCEILTTIAGGEFKPVEVTGPRGNRVSARFGLVPPQSVPSLIRAQRGYTEQESKFKDSPIAVVEMAAASGLALLPPAERDPWQTTTQGTGELLRAAAEARAAAIVLGIGGSATHDLGLGALGALGMQFFDRPNNPVHPPIPANWDRIVRISGGAPVGFPPIFIACDVVNPLLGPRGAAAVYGPQKGLRPEDHARLEAASERMADLLCRQSGQSLALKSVPGTGAAGGISFGLMTACGAKLVPGFDLVTAWVGLDAKLAAADIVITGEGCFDDSSLDGKGPGSVVSRALSRGKEVHVFAGQVSVESRPGVSLHAITPAGTPLAQALRETPQNLAAAARAVFAR
ncbi:MAG TPA: glycerate kinase [Candidatus Didemnitutus sp.]|nr:glycerate kinase [Candidatus Didemnitutus sp.]